MIKNLQIHSLRQPRSRQHGPAADPKALPLNWHPWVELLHEMIQTRCPEQLPPFLQLLIALLNHAATHTIRMRAKP